MCAILPPDGVSRICFESETLRIIDHFDRLPDSVVLLVFNKIGDVKALGRCSAVSRRFRLLVPQVEDVLVRVDCVISDDDSSSLSSIKSRATAASAGWPFSTVFRLVIGGIVKPLQAFGQFIGPIRSPASASFMSIDGDDDDGEVERGNVTHHSPTQVLKNFNEIRFLRIELPSGELGIDDGVLLKWRAEFGSTLDKCVILGATSVIYPESASIPRVLEDTAESTTDEANGSIPEAFYTNGGLKRRVFWTISSLIAASARHYLLQPIIEEHKTLDHVMLTDEDGQGLLCMTRNQLEELRGTPLSASSDSKRTLLPALNLRLWYASNLELPDGTVLKGASLVAIRPNGSKNEVCDVSWLSSAFEEPFRTAAKMLVKRKTYCLEMNSF